MGRFVVKDRGGGEVIGDDLAKSGSGGGADGMVA